jgi:hypothetical protein
MGAVSIARDGSTVLLMMDVFPEEFLTGLDSPHGGRFPQGA